MAKVFTDTDSLGTPNHLGGRINLDAQWQIDTAGAPLITNEWIDDVKPDHSLTTIVRSTPEKCQAESSPTFEGFVSTTLLSAMRER